MKRQGWLLLGLLARTAAAQGSVTGTVYDSLVRAPLRGADVWIRGSQQRTQTDSSGRFLLDSIAPGRYTLLVSHPGLDSAGLFTLAVPITVTGGEMPVRVVTPSLGTLWQRHCGQDLMMRVDSGLVFGVIEDAATHAHLAGAGVLLQWLRITQTDSVTVQTQPRQVAVRTDSTGTYYACGISRTMKLALRAYAQHDSSGLIDLMLGRRGIGRQDMMVALRPTGSKITPAVVRGQATTTEQTPVWGGRVAVREGATTMIGADGGFVLRDVAPGTQWITVQAIGRAPAALAVDLRPGDTAFLPVTLGPIPVTLAPVRVEGQQSRMLHDFEERRRLGSALGYFRGEDDIKDLASLRSIFTTLPSIRLVRGSGNTDFVAVLPAPEIGGGWCVPSLYIDGFLSDWDQIHIYQPKDLAGVELYPRPGDAPPQYQLATTRNSCGVVLIWTKYLR